MNEELESRLRAALRPVTPSDEFTRDLIARVAADQRSSSDARSAQGRRPRARRWWLSASMAASLLVAAGVQHQLQERHVRQGLGIPTNRHRRGPKSAVGTRLESLGGNSKPQVTGKCRYLYYGDEQSSDRSRSDSQRAASVYDREYRRGDRSREAAQ